MGQPSIRKSSRLGLALLLSSNLLSGNVFASNWWYAELGASRTSIDVSGTEFNPVVPRLKLGFIITQKFMLEVQYAGSGDDTVANTNMEIEDVSAAYLRLDSGIRSNMRMYVLLGGAETSLKTSNPDGTNSSTDSYSDFSWGIGLEDRTWSKSTLLTLEYIEYYNHDDVTISAISLGFKYEY